MGIRVGINGFGRMGRLVLRAAWESTELDFVHINEPKGGVEAAAHLLSVDYRDDPRSAVIDAPSSMVVDGNQVKVLAWYDNEIGYVHRMAELAGKVAQSLTG